MTCSLPCVKRHKKRAQCNGKRDPGAYVKISDLATPAGIDKDYNYLTSIERVLDNSDRDATARGFQLDDKIQRPGRPAKGKEQLRKALENSGAIIMKAPQGMSRNSRNATHWLGGSDCLEWTVEWVDPAGGRKLSQCRDSQTFSEAYAALHRPKKRRKRKMRSSPQISPPETIQDMADDPASDERVGNGGPPQMIHEETAPETYNADLRFYLHSPSLPSRQTVLKPVASGSTLSDALRNSIVLEYPTIYVFDRTQGESMPPSFIEEDEYYKTARKGKIEELEEGIFGENKPEVRNDPGHVFGKLDSSKIAEVLGKDLGRK